MPEAPAVIVHVAEAFAGGVRAAITEYALSVPEAEHHLVFARRSDAPVSATDLAPFRSATELVPGHLGRVRQLRALLRHHPDAVVHAHSSFAGAYVRLAATRRRRQIVYTPHCFAFERRDLSRPSRAAYRIIERALAANTTAYAACSPRELELARSLGGRARAVLVPNIAPTGAVARHDPPLRPVVVGVGRVSPQKDPSYFAHAVRAAREAGLDVDAVWVGGGGSPSLESDLVDAGIEVTGWLQPDEVLDRLASATLYLHTAAWEGFPVSVLEAVAVGLPVAVRAAPCFEGWGFPRELAAPEELAAILPDVLAGPGEADVRFRSSLLARCSRESQRAGLLEAYA